MVIRSRERQHFALTKVWILDQFLARSPTLLTPDTQAVRYWAFWLILDALETGEIRAIPQQHDLATFAPKISKADSRIDWHLPAIEIDRRIRAMTPTPGAWTMIDTGEDGTPISIAPVLINRDVVLEPGVTSLVDKRVFVGSATYALELTQVKPAGKKFMDATDWLRGLRSEVVRLF